MDAPNQIPQLISMSVMCKMFGRTATGIDGMVARGVLPQPLLIGGDTRRWYLHEAQAVLDAAKAEREERIAAQAAKLNQPT